MNNETTNTVNEPMLLFKGSNSQFNPKLAETLSLNEAIVLQQLHSLIEENPDIIDGYNWVHKMYDEWQEDHFPFWSRKTVERIFRKLENKELIKIKRYHYPGLGVTNYYRINYENLERYLEENE